MRHLRAVILLIVLAALGIGLLSRQAASQGQNFGSSVNQTQTNCLQGNGFWVTSTDNIFLNVTSNGVGWTTQFALMVRFMNTTGTISTLTEGPVAVTAGANSQGGTLLYVVPPGPGCIVMITAYPAAGNAVAYGQVWANIMIGQCNLSLSGSGTVSSATWNACTTPPPQILQQGYTSMFEQLTWPQVTPPPVPWNQGFNVALNVSNPSAGADWTVSPTTLIRACIQSVTMKLVTSATVANRYVELVGNDNGNFDSVYVSTIPIPASTTAYISFQPGAFPASITQSNGTLWVTAPFNNSGQGLCFGIGNGFSIQSVSQNLQAGDQYSAIYIRETVWTENN